MSCFVVPRNQNPCLSCSHNPRQGPCVLLAEQGNDLTKGRTYCTCPCTSCALLLVDREIEAHQAKSSPTPHGKVSSSNPPTTLSDSVSRMTFEYSDDQMHKDMALICQVSSASDDEEMTVPTSKNSSSKTSGTKPLPDDVPNEEVDAHFTATGVCKIARTLQSAAQPPCPPPTAFSLLNLRSSRDAFGDAQSRGYSSSPRNDVAGPRPTVASRHSASPTPLASSAILDVAGLPLEYKQAKTKSWPGPSDQIPRPDIVSMPKTTNSKARKCDITCVQFKERKMRFGDRMSSCRTCLLRSETCSFNRCSIRLQPLEEHTRGEEAADHKQAATMEEDRSHFSDFSTDDEDNERPPHTRLVNSLGRLSRRSKTRLSWGSIFSKP